MVKSPMDRLSKWEIVEDRVTSCSPWGLSVTEITATKILF